MSAEYNVKLPIFEGPLDLLLHLIKVNEMEITEISISQITGQYLETVRLMEHLDLDVAGEFLVMAASLLNIKLRSILPDPEEEIEEEGQETEGDDYLSARALMQRLIEYRRFKEAAGTLGNMAERQALIFVREVAIPTLNEAQADAAVRGDLNLLLEAFSRVIKFVQRRDYHEVQNEEYTIDDKIIHVRRRLVLEERIVVDELFSQCHAKIEMIVTLIALLELCRLKEITISQIDCYGSIIAYPRRDGQGAPDSDTTQEAEEIQRLEAEIMANRTGLVDNSAPPTEDDEDALLEEVLAAAVGEDGREPAQAAEAEAAAALEEAVEAPIDPMAEDSEEPEAEDSEKLETETVIEIEIMAEAEEALDPDAEAAAKLEEGARVEPDEDAAAKLDAGARVEPDAEDAAGLDAGARVELDAEDAAELDAGAAVQDLTEPRTEPFADLPTEEETEAAARIETEDAPEPEAMPEPELDAMILDQSELATKVEPEPEPVIEDPAPPAPEPEVNVEAEEHATADEEHATEDSVDIVDAVDSVDAVDRVDSGAGLDTEEAPVAEEKPAAIEPEAPVAEPEVPAAAELEAPTAEPEPALRSPVEAAPEPQRAEAEDPKPRPRPRPQKKSSEISTSSPKVSFFFPGNQSIAQSEPRPAQAVAAQAEEIGTEAHAEEQMVEKALAYNGGEDQYLSDGLAPQEPAGQNRGDDQP